MDFYLSNFEPNKLYGKKQNLRVFFLELSRQLCPNSSTYERRVISWWFWNWVQTQNSKPFPIFFAYSMLQIIGELRVNLQIFESSFQGPYFTTTTLNCLKRERGGISWGATYYAKYRVNNNVHSHQQNPGSGQDCSKELL